MITDKNSTSNSRRLLALIIGCITPWLLIFLAIGLPIFRVGFKVPIATIASYVGICCAVQLAISPWLLYAWGTPEHPEGRVTHRVIAPTVFLATISVLFFYYIRRSRPEDPSTREFTSIGMAIAVFLPAFFATVKLYLVSRHDKERDTVKSDYGKPTAWAQTEIQLVYGGFIVAWFCFLFILQKMNLHRHGVSASVFEALCVLAALAILVGFAMRRRFFRLSSEALPHDPHNASDFWRSAHFISFSCAINPAILGAVLKILGSDWLVPGILFGLSLGFLLLWRPRPLEVN